MVLMGRVIFQVFQKLIKRYKLFDIPLGINKEK